MVRDAFFYFILKRPSGRVPGAEMTGNPTFKSALAAVIFSTLLPGLCASPALAADLDAEIMENAGVTRVEYGSGWYLRGDIGTYFGDGKVGFSSGGSLDLADQHLGADISYSVGFGHIFNDRFRADLTLSRLPGFNYYGISPLVPYGGGYSGDCLSEETAHVDVTSLQANAYLTMGEWNRLKPYLGMGLGVASASWSKYERDDYCLLDPGEDCALATHSGGAGVEVWQTGAPTTSHEKSLLLVGSIIAGVDYRLSDSLSVDMGYKYSRTADIGLGGSDFSKIRSLNLHEVRIGLRYEIW